MKEYFLALLDTNVPKFKIEHQEKSKFWYFSLKLDPKWPNSESKK